MIINYQIILIFILIISIAKITFNSINKYIFNHATTKKDNRISEMRKAYEEILKEYDNEFKENELLIKKLKDEYNHYKYLNSQKKL